MSCEPGDRPAAVRRLVAAHDGAPAATVTRLGAGLDNVAYLVDGRLVVRFADGSGAGDRVAREARLLALVGAVSPLPVPVPAWVDPDACALAYERLPGVPLLQLGPDAASRHAAATGAALGRLLRELHTLPAARVEGLVEVDLDPPEEWLSEAARHRTGVASALPPAAAGRIDAFLAADPPARADRPVFTHNDLGAEHVLVDPATGEVTGVIDWSDAALADPARDLGLIARDLGPAALEAALEARGDAAEADPGLLDRALFHARCALLEDLAYGLGTGRREYADKSLAALGWLFEPPGRVR